MSGAAIFAPQQWVQTDSLRSPLTPHTLARQKGGPRSVVRIKPGDLVAVFFDGAYYYAAILDRVRLFGGNLVYVFHRHSTAILPADELLAGSQPGFHAFVDFIWAQREGRLQVIGRQLSFPGIPAITHFKETNTLQGKAKLWFIYDQALKEVRRVSALTEDQKRFPLYERIDDTIMVQRVLAKWVPESDPRI